MWSWAVDLCDPIVVCDNTEDSICTFWSLIGKLVARSVLTVYSYPDSTAKLSCNRRVYWADELLITNTVGCSTSPLGSLNRNETSGFRMMISMLRLESDACDPPSLASSIRTCWSRSLRQITSYNRSDPGNQNHSMGFSGFETVTSLKDVLMCLRLEGC